MKKILFTIIFIVLVNILYSQEKNDYEWYSSYQIKELKREFGKSYADSIDALFGYFRTLLCA